MFKVQSPTPNPSTVNKPNASVVASIVLVMSPLVAVMVTFALGIVIPFAASNCIVIESPTVIAVVGAFTVVSKVIGLIM